MYIKIARFGICGRDYSIYTANHHQVLTSNTCWNNKSACIRAAKKMAKKLNIEYRENYNG